MCIFHTAGMLCVFNKCHSETEQFMFCVSLWSNIHTHYNQMASCEKVCDIIGLCGNKSKPNNPEVTWLTAQ